VQSSSAELFRSLQRRIFRALGAIVGLLMLGVVGYMILEGWDFLDALYMTVITLASVGYGETRPLDPPGRVFTILLILLGVAALGFLINQVLQAVSEGYFREGLELRRRQRMINKLANHFIVCGFGRMGRRICTEFAQDNMSFVVIEQEPQSYARAQQAGYIALLGDASTDQTLVEAGIERARCIVCALPSDADNLFIILSARNLNPKIRTITRASSDEAAIKLRRGGADEVVSPYDAGARRMAAIALRPGVVDFIEATFVGNNRQIYIEEFRIDAQNCPYIGKRLQDTNLRTQTGTLILAIRRADGSLIGGPTGDTLFLDGDLLFCLGSSTQLKAFTDLLLPLRT